MARRTELSSLESHLGYWIRSVSNHVSHAFALKLAAVGVTVAEWVVLRELYDSENAPSAVAERLGMTRGAISKLAERLIDKELIVRRATAGDRRFQSLALTPRGARSRRSSPLWRIRTTRSFSLISTSRRARRSRRR